MSRAGSGLLLSGIWVRTFKNLGFGSATLVCTGVASATGPYADLTAKPQTFTGILLLLARNEVDDFGGKKLMENGLLIYFTNFLYACQTHDVDLIIKFLFQ